MDDPFEYECTVCDDKKVTIYDPFQQIFYRIVHNNRHMMTLIIKKTMPMLYDTGTDVVQTVSVILKKENH